MEPGGGDTTDDPGYLSCGEIPEVNVVAESLASGDEVNFSGSDEVTTWYRYDVVGNADQKVVIHTFEYNDQVLRNYSLLYDKTKKAALWAAFAMNGDVYPSLISRTDDWNYDPALDHSWQPNLSSSYTESAYERGHQVASADRNTTIYQRKQTCYYSNMTPQLGSFNSGDNTLWDNLEGKIQSLGAQTRGNNWLYVVTGAIFDEGNMTYAHDKNNVACPVPAQYYKCIMKVTYNASGEVTGATGAAYLFDHESDALQQNKTIRELETLTHINFFANIPSEFQEPAETTFTNML